MADFALASRSIDNPEDSYQVLGELQAGLTALVQVLSQMSSFHDRERGRAVTDHGDAALGAEHAETAAYHLKQASRFISRATDEVIAGFACNGQIAWRRGPLAETLAERENTLPASPEARRDRSRSPGSFGR
ncbi:hypothetical protein GCM10011359_09840 [Nesterenkonia alkaliphila]|nr:hypothetical protein GCM10011359_09840 [Nesterenkonia alkaliphila]